MKEQKERQSKRRHRGRVERMEREHIFQAAATGPGTKDPFVWAESWSQTEQIREEISKSLPPERLSVS